MLTTLALLAKFQATNLLVGHSRFALIPAAGTQDFDGTSKLAEKENKYKGDEKAIDRTRKAKAAEVRNVRLVMNDLENIPLGLIVTWMGVLCGASQRVQVISLWTFCLGRFIHSYAYKGKLPMIRALSFTAGFLATFVMAGNAAIAVAFL